MGLLTTQSITRAGTVVTPVAAAGGGDTFVPDANTCIRVVNGSGAPITVTIATPGTVSGLAIADVTGSVAAGATKEFGPMPGPLVADPVTGLGSIAYSLATSVTVAAWNLSQP